jgi:threonylcarbamoyladenosine tRNA methylthiotransferase MtaB
VLCGICLGAFGRDLKPRKDLVDAIKALENIEGILRIRLSSIEAADVSEQLIEKLAQSKKLCRHLHIPIQSGDDAILKKMHRRYTGDDYLSSLRK